MKASLGSYQQYENLVHMDGGSALNADLSGGVGTGTITIPPGVALVQLQAKLPTNTTYMVHILPSDVSATAGAVTALTAEGHVLKDQTMDIPIDWRKGKYIGWRVTDATGVVAGNQTGAAGEQLKVTLLKPRA